MLVVGPHERMDPPAVVERALYDLEAYRAAAEGWSAEMEAARER